MDTQAWIAVASAIGSGLAAFAATWATLVRPLKKQVNQPSQELAELARRVDSVEHKVQDQEKRDQEKGHMLQDHEVRLRRTVTDEEFGAYTAATSNSISNLTEKVGRAHGAIELWLRQGR